MYIFYQIIILFSCLSYLHEVRLYYVSTETAWDQEERQCSTVSSKH